MTRSNLRKSLDTALLVEKVLTIGIKYMAKVLETTPELSDEVVVAIAEMCNAMQECLSHFQKKTIPDIQEMMTIWGDEGPEKEFEVQVEEVDSVEEAFEEAFCPEEDEEEDDESEGYQEGDGEEWKNA